MGCEQGGSAFADVADSEPEQQARQAALAAAVDGVQEVTGGLRGQAVEALKSGLLQVVEIRKVVHQVAIHQLFHDRGPQAVDVHGAPVAVMQQPLAQLRGAYGIRAASHHLP